MKLNRRTVVATALASPLILRAAAAADDLSATIKINTENTRGEIDRSGLPPRRARGRARARRDPAALATTRERRKNGCKEPWKVAYWGSATKRVRSMATRCCSTS